MSPQWNLPYIDTDPQVCEVEKPLLTGQSTVSPSTLYPSSWHSFSAHPVAKITCASSEDSCIHVIVSKIVQKKSHQLCVQAGLYYGPALRAVEHLAAKLVQALLHFRAPSQNAVEHKFWVRLLGVLQSCIALHGGTSMRACNARLVLQHVARCQAHST